MLLFRSNTMLLLKAKVEIRSESIHRQENTHRSIVLMRSFFTTAKAQNPAGVNNRKGNKSHFML